MRCREIGELGDLERHCRLGTQAVRAAQQVEMPRTWRTDLSIMELDVRWHFSGKMWLTVAEGLVLTYRDRVMSWPPTGCWRRRFLTPATTGGLPHWSGPPGHWPGSDPTTRPTENDLCLSLLAEQSEPAAGDLSHALRYARRQARLRWQSRLTALASMRSLVHGERLRGEHALFRRHAFIDDLTGLANRREFQRFMAVMADKGVERLTLVLCDVDRFKDVNDKWGHPVGDMVLVEVASLLAASVRSADLAARLGGDEFVLLLDNVEPGAAEVRATTIVRDVAERSWAHVQPGLEVRVSVGLAVGHSGRADELLSRADVALYQAKAAGGSRCVVAP